MAGDRDTLRRDQRSDADARRHVQASGADIQDAGDGVPRYDDAGENEGDWVGHLVALAHDTGSPVAAMQQGGESPPPTAETGGNCLFLTRRATPAPQGHAEPGPRELAL